MEMARDENVESLLESYWSEEENCSPISTTSYESSIYSSEEDEDHLSGRLRVSFDNCHFNLAACSLNRNILKIDQMKFELNSNTQIDPTKNQPNSFCILHFDDRMVPVFITIKAFSVDERDDWFYSLHRACELKQAIMLPKVQSKKEIVTPLIPPRTISADAFLAPRDFFKKSKVNKLKKEALLVAPQAAQIPRNPLEQMVRNLRI